MIDLNDIQQIEKVKEAGKSLNGQTIIEYLRTLENRLDYSNIPEDDTAGREFLRIRGLKNELKKIIEFLTAD